MEFQEVIDRWLVPVDFEARPIPAESLSRIVRSARRFDFDVLVLETATDRRRFWRTHDPYSGLGRDGWGTVYQAPVVLVICAPVSHNFRERFVALSGALAEMTAIDAGLGAMPIDIFRVGEVCREFDIPADRPPTSAVVIGYATKAELIHYGRTSSRQSTESIHYGHWGMHTTPRTNK